MMSTQKIQDDQEIDLSVIAQKITHLIDDFKLSVFKSILFVKKNSLIFAGLLILGVAVGFYFDQTSKAYDSEIIVTPNISGTDYLYSKIGLLKSKLDEDDTAFFKSIGFKNPDALALIEIDPIIDIYGFVNSGVSAASATNTQNFELIKLFAESGDINKVITDKLTSKNYPHHLIHIITKDKTTIDETIKPLMKYLNTDEYLNQILSISKENIKIKMKKNYELINQTDSLIRILTTNLSKNQKGSNLVYNNENNQFNSFFDLKNNLTNEIAGQKIALIDQNVIVKDISTVVNIKRVVGINGKLKYILPILFVVGYLLFNFFMSFYKKQEAKYLAKQ